jgi:hypothetical protein
VAACTVTDTHWFPATTVLKILVEILLIALSYHLMFLLKEHVAFADVY